MSFYKSQPLKFIAGGETFYVHENVLAAHSDPLHDMMTQAKMKEAEQGYATLEDVTADTFASVLQWMYQGFYNFSQPSQPLNAKPEPSKILKAAQYDSFLPDEPPPADDFLVEPADVVHDGGWGTYGSSTSGKKKAKKISQPSKRERLRQQFLEEEYTVFTRTISLPNDKAVVSKSGDLAEILLAHARVYVFAQQYFINKLKTWALEALHETLKSVDVTEKTAGDIIALIDYAYENTSSPGKNEISSDNQSEAVQPLRKLLTDLIACEMDVLIREPKFGRLLVEEGGDLVDDFLGTVRMRI